MIPAALAVAGLIRSSPSAAATLEATGLRYAQLLSLFLSMLASLSCEHQTLLQGESVIGDVATAEECITGPSLGPALLNC